MRRPVALLLAAFMLLAPSAAMAQSAGDEQYADPFGEVEEPSGSQEEPAAPAEPAPAPAETGVPAEEAVASQEADVEADAPTLPATGLPAGVIAAAGALLFAGGGVLRRRVS